MFAVVPRRCAFWGAFAALLGSACFVEPPSVGVVADSTDAICADVEQPDDGPACPAICNGGCSERECQILCRPDQPCHGELACPQELACDVDCEGAGVCEGAVFTCPGDYACSLSCAGPSACGMTELECGFSECAIECGPDDTACTGTHVRCSHGACTAECVPGALPWLDGCEQACECSEC